MASDVKASTTITSKPPSRASATVTRASPSSMLPKPSLATCCAASVQRRAAARTEVRIFLDANVLFSAAKSDGFVRRLLELLLADGHVLCADGYVAEEARRNLAAKGPQGLPALAALLAFRKARMSSSLLMSW